MRIECPTCHIGLNVSDDQVGEKGLCPKCGTKFIIPADPDDEIEVLAEGKVPEEESKSDTGSEKEEVERLDPVEDVEDIEDVEDVDDEEHDGAVAGAGKAVGLLGIGLVVGLAIGFAIGQMTAGGGGDDAADDGDSGTPAETSDPFALDS